MTDPAIVGTIAACPRCSSMVQIERIGNQVAVGASNIDSEAITEDAIAAPGESDLSETPASGGFSGADSLDDATDQRLDETTPLPPDWQSPKTHRSRQIALVVALSVTGLLTAVLFFSWFVRNWNQTPAVAEIDRTSSQGETELVGPGPEDAVSEDVVPEDGKPATQVPSKELPDNEMPANKEPANKDPASNDPTNKEPANNDSVDVSSADVNDRSNSKVEPKAVAADPEPTVPNDLMPASPIVAVATAEDAGDDPNQDAPQLMELPPGFAEFTEILEQGGPIDLRPTLDAPPTLDELDIKAAAEEELDPMLVATPAKKINIRSDLAIQIALDSDGYRLTDLVLLFSQLTSVPIQIDWVSFDLMGIDVHERIPTPKTSMKSAKELLDAIAASLGAEIQDKEYFLLLTPSDAPFDAKLAELTALDDFGPGRGSAVKVLNEFLNGPGDALPELTIGPTREDKQFALLAVESLRRMRGLEAKVSNKLLMHWAQASEDQSIEWPLLTGGAAPPQRSAPISVAGLIHHTAKLNESSCVVYWPDAIRRQLYPTHLLLPHAEKDAAATLHQVIEDFGLQVRSVDANRWWLGTAATYDRATVVVWTKPLGENAETLQSRIAGVMSGPDTFRIAMDPQSDRAIMLLPRYIVRQLPKIEASIAAK